jgi:DNA-binding transcriptional regulator YbjK
MPPPRTSPIRTLGWEFDVFAPKRPSVGTVTGSMQVVTEPAVTPKGERRRFALVSAAADLLCEGGFEAVRHRAVARRAGLPLASTTYYFASLDDLIAAAVEDLAMRESTQLQTRVAALTRRRRGLESTADVLVELLVDAPDAAPQQQLIARYERYIACARHPALRDIQRRVMQQRNDAIGQAVELSGRRVRSDLLSALVCAVDGAVVSALVDDGYTPQASARAALLDVIDVLAPFDQEQEKEQAAV